MAHTNAQRRAYVQTESGQASLRRYRLSAKGQAAGRKYRVSEKGRAAVKRSNDKRVFINRKQAVYVADDVRPVIQARVTELRAAFRATQEGDGCR